MIPDHSESTQMIPPADARVAVIGVGSVGGFVAWGLASAGVELICLVDPDRLSVDNLRRHVGRRPDIGERKVDLLRRDLTDRFPRVTVEARAVDVIEEPESLSEIIARVDGIVVAVDREAPKYLIDGIARELGRPTVFTGLYGSGWAAEFAISRDEGPCYGCLAHALGRTGIPTDVGPAYVDVRPTRPDSTWPRADVTGIQIAAAITARVTVSMLNSRTCADAGHDSQPKAWRLPFVDVPDWGPAYVRIDVPVPVRPGCLVCGTGAGPHSIVRNRAKR